MTKQRTEEDIKIKDVLRQLEAAGFDRHQMKFEYTCKSGRIDILIQQPYKAIVECKRPGVDFKKAITQGCRYARELNIETVYVSDGSNTELFTHNGEIWAESQINNGSTIHFTLPI